MIAPVAIELHESVQAIRGPGDTDLDGGQQAGPALWPLSGYHREYITTRGEGGRRALPEYKRETCVWIARH